MSTLNLCVDQWDVDPGVADQVRMLEVDWVQVTAKKDIRIYIKKLLSLMDGFVEEVRGEESVGTSFP